jgi:hypothetical protein
MELTMIRNWVQTHLIYKLLLNLPLDASPHEQKLLKKIINAEASDNRRGMMTQIAIFRSKAATDRVSLPKQLAKPINLHNIHLDNANGLQVYDLLLAHCQTIWPHQQARHARLAICSLS